MLIDCSISTFDCTGAACDGIAKLLPLRYLHVCVVFFSLGAGVGGVGLSGGREIATSRFRSLFTVFPYDRCEGALTLTFNIEFIFQLYAV